MPVHHDYMSFWEDLVIGIAMLFFLVFTWLYLSSMKIWDKNKTPDSMCQHI